MLCLVDSRRFEYVNNVLYFAITSELDGAGKYVHSDFYGPVYKYETHSNLTAVYTFDPSIRAQERHIIDPVGLCSPQASYDLLRRIGKLEYPFPFDSDHHFVALKAPNFSSSGSSDY
jgi:hypothetical protein